MSKKQTRRSVSMRGTTYDLAQAHCKKYDLAMSDFVEQRLAEFFGIKAPTTSIKPSQRAANTVTTKPTAVTTKPATVTTKPAKKDVKLPEPIMSATLTPSTGRVTFDRGVGRPISQPASAVIEKRPKYNAF